MSRQPPVARVGEYHVLDFVGAGGMGEVFRAVHSRSGQVAAVKFLSGGDDLSPEARAKWRQRFIHEARVQESLRHPHLAAFYEWHEAGATPCIVMELVDGQALASRLQSGPLALPETLAIFQQVVEAVAFMHSRGVIHRDIKSGNIKINSRGEVKLLDFGIAKTGDTPRLTSTGAFVGTLQYLSPEQVKGAEADARCDVWALGALFYEMLSGRPPFEAATWGELLEKVARAQVQPLGPSVPREVDAVVRRCLQKQPQARFADATQLLHALSIPAPQSKKVNDGPIIRPRARTNAPLFASLCGAGLLVSGAAWLLWPRTTVPFNPVHPDGVQRTPSPLSTDEPLTPNSGDDGSLANNSAVKDNNSGASPMSGDRFNSSDLKTITVDVFEGASETRVARDGQFVGRAPCQFKARVGDTLDLDLSRPGFQDQHVAITVTGSRDRYSFNMEPLSP